VKIHFGALLLIALTAFAQSAWANTCSAKTGTVNWDSNGSWSGCGGKVPQDGDTVIIPNGSTVTLNKDSKKIASLTVNAGGTLQGNGSGKNLDLRSAPGNLTNNGTINLIDEDISIDGAFINNGVFTAGTGKVKLKGNAAQTISGNVVFNDLKVDNGSANGLLLNGNVTVNGGLSGNAVSGGQVTLVSTCPTDYTLVSNGGTTVQHSCPTSLAPLAEYRLEESVWNGSAGEVLDSSGNNRHGTTIGNPLPAPAGALPALAGNPGTCGYGSMPGPFSNGGTFNLPGLPVNTAAGAKTSVAFWMFWDGTNSVMPIGWFGYDLWLVGGHFGFNTGNSDVFGIGSAGLASGWHHVAAVFTNGNVAGNKLYIDGVAQSLTQRLSTPNNTASFVNSTLRAGGWQRDNNYRFSGRLDEVKVYNGELKPSEVSTIRAATHPCAPTTVAEWRMDETSWNGSPGEVADSSVNALHGTALLGASTASGKLCNAGNFAANYAQVADSPVLDITNALTVAVWIKPARWGGTPGKAPLMSFYSKDTNYEAHVTSTGKINWWWGTGNITSAASVPVNAWTHVAMVYTPGSQKLYINGVLSASGTVAGNLPTNNLPFQIGDDQNFGGGTRRFDGMIDELKIFNEALAPIQINSGYANENAGKNWNGSARICPVPATPLAEYRLEESVWNGSAGEVLDSSGNNRHGTTIGNPLPAPAGALPALAGNPGTCGYGSMPGPFSNGGTFNLPGLPVNTAAGAKTSVAFWMFWDGTNSVMPIGWFGYDLWLVGGHFGFNTGNSDVFGIGSAGLASGWHHVAAVFTNGNVAGNKLYIDGVAQSLTQRLSTPNNTASFVNSTLRAGGWQRDNNYRFSGRLDEVKVYNGELKPSEVSTIRAVTHPCSGLVVPSGFNAFEPATPDGNVNGVIYTKLAATPFNLDVVALKIGPAVETGFTGDVKVELVDASGGAGCGARPVIGPAQTLTFAAADAGRKAGTFTGNNAWQNVTVRMSHPATGAPAVVACSTDAFAIRPQTFVVSANLGGATLAAGLNFSMTASSGYNNYTGTPVLHTALLRDHNNAVIGTLLGNFPAAVAGGAAGNTFQYHDVGTISLLADAVSEGNFTGVDQPNDCVIGSTANVLTGGKYGCEIGSAPAGPFGRFYPHHFTYAAILAPACAGFTYMDQPNLGISLTLQAMSAAETVTARYTAGYGSLGTFDITGDNGGNAVNLARLTPVLPAFLWNNGSYTVNTAASSFARDIAPDGPYDNFTLKANILAEPDGVNILGSNLSNATRIRYGRIRMLNAYGSELLPLNIPLTVQHFNGSGWSTNTLDTCTTLAASNMAYTFSGNLAACETAGTLSGSAPTFNLRLAAAGAGNNGTADMTLNLGIAAAGNTCTSVGGPGPAATTANRPWLQLPGGINPAARATFGVYQGNDTIIYQRESY